jgi:hypothetical protein
LADKVDGKDCYSGKQPFFLTLRWKLEEKAAKKVPKPSFWTKNKYKNFNFL